MTILKFHPASVDTSQHTTLMIVNSDGSTNGDEVGQMFQKHRKSQCFVVFETNSGSSINECSQKDSLGPCFLGKKWSCTKNVLAQKHTFKKQTDYSFYIVGGFYLSEKYAQVTLDHFGMDWGESSKNVWNYHLAYVDFRAKPHDPQKFGEIEVTKSRRPVSQGTWQE